LRTVEGVGWCRASRGLKPPALLPKANIHPVDLAQDMDSA
jgi:hypothetical protein